MEKKFLRSSVRLGLTKMTCFYQITKCNTLNIFMWSLNAHSGTMRHLEVIRATLCKIQSTNSDLHWLQTHPATNEEDYIYLADCSTSHQKSCGDFPEGLITTVTCYTARPHLRLIKSTHNLRDHVLYSCKVALTHFTLYKRSLTQCCVYLKQLFLFSLSCRCRHKSQTAWRNHHQENVSSHGIHAISTKASKLRSDVLELLR